ncbi:MAG TPA: DUF2867 domain-containing protein [Cyclobacteriaceae bacterium]|nr:DUF2867 domain-containing protein [Cyclobacteriaceae bacterium]
MQPSFPDNSLLKQYPHRVDYADTYEGLLKDPENRIDATALGQAFFQAGPKWVVTLFGVRNKLATVVGLKSSGTVKERQLEQIRFRCEPGEKMGLFKVYDKNDFEVILGEDDKHLDFRVSLLLLPDPKNPGIKKLLITTLVKFNNAWGKVYFLPVRPFHKLIVPSMLNNMIRQLTGGV